MAENLTSNEREIQESFIESMSDGVGVPGAEKMVIDLTIEQEAAKVLYDTVQSIKTENFLQLRPDAQTFHDYFHILEIIDGTERDYSRSLSRRSFARTMLDTVKEKRIQR